MGKTQSSKPISKWRPEEGGDSPEDVVDAHDAVRPGGAAVVHDGGVALDPHPPSVLGQHAVVLCGDLALHQHYREQKTPPSIHGGSTQLKST